MCEGLYTRVQVFIDHRLGQVLYRIAAILLVFIWFA